MMPRDTEDPNPAQIRGDIQRGITGDKRPGFDPAMAPLETDSEAGGEPLSPQQVSAAIQSQDQQSPQLTFRNFDVAMGSSLRGTRKRTLSLPAVLPLVAVAAVAAALLVGVLLR